MRLDHFRKILYQTEPRKNAWNRGFSWKIMNFARQKLQRHYNNSSKPNQNVDHVHQNLRKSSKSWKITSKSSAKSRSTFNNAPKANQNQKNTEKSQRVYGNAPKTWWFSKNLVSDPRKNVRKTQGPAHAVGVMVRLRARIRMRFGVCSWRGVKWFCAWNELISPEW